MSERFRARARLLRYLAVAFCTLIVITVCIGVPLFVLAGSITARDEVELREQMSWEATVPDKQGAKVPQTPQNSVDAPPLELAAAPPVQPTVGETRTSPTAVQRTPLLVVGATAVDASTLSTMVTRIGLAVLMVCLVYVLGGLYRYSMQLSAFNSGRADALRLLPNGDEQGLERLIALLSPGGSGVPRAAARQAADP